MSLKNLVVMMSKKAASETEDEAKKEKAALWDVFVGCDYNSGLSPIFGV